jgi:pimeloyl-ACP methyl ester carboxylesterase
MNDHREYCKGPYGQIHFRVCGTGRPLLLCHQSPSSLRQFDAAYARLAARGIMAIGLDTPGFGNSDAPPAPPTIEDYADCVVAVLDHLGIPQADILGQHTGSMTAMAATIRHPARFRRLVLNSPTPFAAEQRREWIDTLVARQRAWTIKPDGSHLQEMWERRVRVTPGWTHLAAVHRNVVDMLLAGDTLWYGHHASLVYDQLANLPRITHPTLVLNNTGDALYPLCRSAHTLRPDFSYAEIEGGTHDIVDEQPDAWVAAVADFLLRTPD